MVRPQTTARSVGVLFSLDTRSPFDRAPAWRELKGLYNGKKVTAIRDAVFRRGSSTRPTSMQPGVDLDRSCSSSPSATAVRAATTSPRHVAGG